MNKIFSQIKRFVPSPIWQLARKVYYKTAEFVADIGPAVRVKRYCGFDVFYNKGNGLINRLKNEPVFEKELCEAIVVELTKSPDQIFLDIGANIGLVSVYVAAKLPQATIHAFEPGSTQRGFLQRTVSQNKIDNIKVHHQALGDKIGEATFYVHNPKQAALDGLQDTGRRGQTKAVMVPMITLDTWWQAIGMPKVSVIKIDTEGAELLVLRGGKNFITEVKPVIFLEIEPANLQAYPYTADDIKIFFKELGYGLNAINQDTFVARPLVDQK